MGGRGSRRVVGRDVEKAAIDRNLARVGDATCTPPGALVIVEGEAGIGKSTLLAYAADEAIDRGFDVVAGRGDQLASGRPFHLIADVLGATPNAADEDLAAIGSLMTSRSESPLLRHQLEEACVTAVEHMALRRPTLCVIDDAQWADAASVTVVQLIARLTTDLPLLLVVAARFHPRDAQLQSCFDDLTELGAERMTLHGLSDDDAVALVGADGARWNRRAGGNPFLLLEVAAGGGADATTTSQGVILRRVRQLPKDVVDVLSVAAVLGNGFALTELGAAMRRPLAELVPVVSQALAANVLEESAEGLRFRHDLIREALYNDLPSAIAAAVHVETGWALAAAGADPLRVAPHLVAGATVGDVEAITWLERAGLHASHRDLATGIALLDAAASLCDAERRAAVIARTIPLLAWGGRLDEALARGEQLLAEALAPSTEATIRAHLAEAAGLADRADLVARHAPAAAALTNDRAVQIEMRALLSLNERDPAAGLATCEAALADAEAGGDLSAVAVAAAIASMHASDQRRLAEAVGYADRAVAAARAAAAARDPDGRTAARLLYALHLHAAVLNLVDRTAEALVVAEEARAVATSLGASSVVDALTWLIATLHTDLAAWDESLAEIDAYELATGDRLGADAGRYVIAALTGDNDTAGRLWHEPDGISDASVAFSLSIRAHHLAQTDREQEALALLRRLFAAATSRGVAWMSRTVSVLTVRLALAAGDHELARDVVAMAEQLAEADPDVPMLAATAALARALVDDDRHLVDRAVETVRPLGDHLRRGWVLLDAARWLVERDRDAGVALALEAYDTLRSIDAAAASDAKRLLGRGSPTARQPAQEVRRSKPRSGWESLTAAELRVVAAVAAGASNPEIAAELYLSRHTVESHLKHIYVKLGMRSRVELAAEAVRRGVGEDP